MKIMSLRTSNNDHTENDLMTATKIKIAKTFKIGISPNAVVGSYNDWSTSFEEIIKQGIYNAPIIALQEVLRRVPPESRLATSVLDVGAGTGWLGTCLHKEGFRKIHALEPSEGMRRVLREKGVYTKEFPESLGTGPCSVPSNTYDVVISSGSFDEGHIPVTGLDELVRVAKKGGLVLIVVLMMKLKPTEPYTGKLEPHMEELEGKGVWIKVERRVFPNFIFEKEGVMFTFRVT
ncbi:hypothetical protein O3P69_018058 [Scylla paramamosain]|uniref:Methyltransferase type 11 domain-containing protein n=1 Tax=Scylla paramamosain TaxID=85552 RepID=A0AAW0THH9_SCYPA